MKSVLRFIRYGKNKIRPASMMIAMFFLSIGFAYGQDHSVSGSVTDYSGESLTGVNVIVKGSSSGTITDINGNYKVNVNPNATLIFSFVGYLKEEVPVNGKSVIDVSLTEDIQVLHELVVVGYGVQKKSDLTGSVIQMGSDDVDNLSSQDITSNLQGRVPGLQIISNSGNPAEGTSVRIRGMGTINNSDPLYVVDGFQTDDISWLTSNDIKSVEVLKDASATAIYGSRGANGVVMITTKDGSNAPKRVNIEFNAYSGVQKAANTIDVMNAHEYIGYRAQGELNRLRAADPNGEYDIYDGIRAFAGADTAIARYTYDNKLKGTDWQDVVLRQSTIQVYNLSIAGNSVGHNYVLGGTYQDNEGILKNSYVEKLTLRFKNDLELTDWVTVGTNISFVKDELTQVQEDRFNGILPIAIRASPLTPVWDENTNNWGSPDLSDVKNNPAQKVEELGMNLWNRHRYVLGAYTQFNITDNFNFRSQAFYSYDQRNTSEYLPEYYINPNASRDPSQLTEGFEERTNWMSSNYFNYTKEFEAHNINAMVGVEWQNDESGVNRITVYDVPQAKELRHINQQRQGDFTTSTIIQRWALQSYFGRLNYSYDSRYILTATLRYDGSSRFDEGNRWGLFPSFAAAWNVDQENFLPKNIFSTLKIRTSWGQVGNERSADPHGTVTYAQPLQNYSFGGEVVNGKSPRELSNPNLKWENSESFNIGADMGFFEDKLTVVADYFIRTTNDMIVRALRPLYAGAEAPLENAGSIENKGFEFAINYSNREHALKYDFGFNMSFTKNEVTSLGSGNDFLNGTNFSHIGIVTRTQVGHPVSSFYGVKTNGIFKSEEELAEYYWQPDAQLGDVKFVNQNGDSTITLAEDGVFLGDPFPDYIYGITGRIEYNGFDFSFLINGSQGNEVVNNLNRYINATGDWADNSLSSRLNYYDPETNPNTNEPRVIAGDPNGNGSTFSDRYVEDASFIRLRNIQLGYTLPASLIESTGLKSLRVYVAADNLFTITDYSGYDPEIGEYFNSPLNFGVAGANYPKPRTFFAGVNIKL